MVRGFIDVRIRNKTIFFRGLSMKQKQYPLAVSSGLMLWGRGLERFMRMSAVKHEWETPTERAVRWEQRQRSLIGNLFISSNLFKMDRQKPHFVPLRKGSKIARWAKEHGVLFDPIKDSFVSSSIFVRPHPFIDRILNKHIKKLVKRVNQEVEKKVVRRK